VPPNGAIRIVGIGDSITFGWGVNERETFLTYLRGRFRREHPDGPPLEIINLAVPGYNAYQEVEAFIAKGLAYHPNLVVVFLCGNDDQLPNFVWRRDPYTIRRSYLADFVSERWARLTTGTISPNLQHTRRLGGGTSRSNDPSRVPRFYRHMVGIEAVARALTRLARVTVERGISVVYVGWESDLNDRIRPIARSLGFIVVDGIAARTQRFLDAGSREYASLLVSSTDRHPNAELHALIGAGIYEEALLPWYREHVERQHLAHSE
jgi:hypothetical protein